jgi:hypothetical protein
MKANAEASQHPTSFELDLLELGGLPADAVARIDEHVQRCAACRAERGSLREARSRFDAHVFPRTLPAVTQRAQRWGRLRLWRALGLGMPALAAAAIALVVWTGPRPGPSSTPFGEVGAESGGDDGVRAKGGATLTVVARQGMDTFALGPAHHTLAPGAELRFVVTATDRPFVMIASIDGAGRATVYYPFDGAESARLGGAGRVELPGSITLDAAAGPERVFALFSREPLAAAQVTQALARLGQQGAAAVRERAALDVTAQDPTSVTQASVLIEKQAEGSTP